MDPRQRRKAIASLIVLSALALPLFAQTTRMEAKAPARQDYDGPFTLLAPIHPPTGAPLEAPRTPQPTAMPTAPPTPRPQPKASPRPKPKATPQAKPLVSRKTTRLSGLATWYRWHVDSAAAGPLLREALGPEWRGRTVTVCANNRCVQVALTDWCACGDRPGGPTLIDLDVRSFDQLVDRGAGIAEVTILW